MPVRVLHVIDHLAHGGAELLVRNIVENIDDEAVEAFVCALRTNPAAISIKGRVINLKYHRYDFRSIFAVAGLCKEHDIDILHAHLGKSIITCLLANFICKRPVIIHEHGGIFRKGLSFSIYRLLLRLLHHRAAGVIANSQTTARRLVKVAGVDADKVEVIYNTIGFDELEASEVLRSGSREKLGILQKDIVVGFVGRLHHLKGVDILIEAFSLLLRQSADYLLVLAGDGPQRKSLEALAARLGIGERVKFLGMCDNVAEVMAAFDIGVVPSRQESFGLVAAELMRMKIPVVSSGEEGLAELVSDGVTGLVTRRNVAEEICRCVQRLADNADLRQRLADAAYAFSGQFGIKEYLHKLRKVYESAWLRKGARMRHICVLGSFSGRNKGDLAILRSQLVQLQRRARDELAVYIFTKDPGWMREYLRDLIAGGLGERKVHIRILRSLTAYIGPKTFPVLARCNKIIIGGGGLFFGQRLFDISFSHLLNLFIITLWLKLLGKEVMVYAVGCSHLDSKLACWMTKIVLNNAKMVSVRDELSKRILSECADKEIMLGGDPSFLLKPKKTARVERIVELWPQGKKILLSLHEYIFIRKKLPEHENVLKQFLVQVYEFAEHNGYSVLTYTNYTNQKFASKIAKLCGKSARTMLKGENHLLPEELIYLLSRVDFVVATQMHVGISAYLAEVPFISLVYDDKVEEFNKRIGNRNYLYLAEMGNNLKVADALTRAGGGEAIARDQLIQMESERLVELLTDFIWS